MSYPRSLPISYLHDPLPLPRAPAPNTYSVKTLLLQRRHLQKFQRVRTIKNSENNLFVPTGDNKLLNVRYESCRGSLRALRTELGVQMKTAEVYSLEWGPYTRLCTEKEFGVDEVRGSV